MTTPIPPEATAAAMASRAHDLADDPDPMVLSDETLTRRELEAAASHIIAVERARIVALLDAWECPCGERGCMGYDTRDQLAALIEEAPDGS